MVVQANIGERAELGRQVIVGQGVLHDWRMPHGGVGALYGWQQVEARLIHPDCRTPFGYGCFPPLVSPLHASAESMLHPAAWAAELASVSSRHKLDQSPCVLACTPPQTPGGSLLPPVSGSI